MEAHIVDKALIAPAKCAVTGDMDGPFIDTGSWVRHHDPYVYLHVPLVEYYARELLGMVSRDKLEELEAQLSSYQAEVEELQRFVDATVEYQELHKGAVAA